MSRGVTLLELLLALLLIGLLALIAIPRLAAVTAAAALRHEATLLVTVLDEARTTAIRLGTVATLTLTDSAYLIEAEIPTDSLSRRRHPGPAMRGARLAGGGAPMRFSPAGIAVGVANRTLTLSRNGVARQVVVSRLGRITP